MNLLNMQIKTHEELLAQYIEENDVAKIISYTHELEVLNSAFDILAECNPEA